MLTELWLTAATDLLHPEKAELPVQSLTVADQYLAALLCANLRRRHLSFLFLPA